MRGIFGLFLAVSAASVVLLARANAADAPAPTAPAVLSDEKRKLLCGRWIESVRFQPADATQRPKPRFPRDDLNAWSEGWVLLGFGIGADGTTNNIEVLDRLGSKNIVSAAVDAVAQWRYRPGTFDGRPVAQFNNRLEVDYQIEGLWLEATHDSIVRKHRHALQLLRDGDARGAVAELESAFLLRANLYEQSRLSFLMALAYLQLNDAPRALQHIRHATLEDGKFLERTISSAAWRLQLQLEARDSNFQYVACHEPLLKWDKADEDADDRAETKREVKVVEAALADPGPLALNATLAVNPWVEGPALWEHPLIRRKFAFDGTNGKVANFKLSCFTQIVEGKVDDTSQWAVPVSAGPCMLRAFGEAGAAFVLIEEW